MGQSNKTLHKGKKGKKDEFYTEISDIEKELKYYQASLKDKIIYCNCDDARESNFFKYFALNFDKLKLKKVISTHFETNKPSYKLEITEGLDLNGDGKINLEDAIETPLKQNGDFRSNECIELLKEADIVVTNPPFSLFREYFSQLIEYQKQFLIMGTVNAITYKEIFPLIKDNKLWAGYNFNKTMEFRLPFEYEKWKRTDEIGNKYGNVPGICWYTNLKHKKRNEELILYKEYNEKEYPKYLNYDAIEVSEVDKIPKDYQGIIGVPITFLGKYNPNQFEIIGNGQTMANEIGIKSVGQDFVDTYYKQGNKGQINAKWNNLVYYQGDKACVPYQRILIRKK